MNHIYTIEDLPKFSKWPEILTSTNAARLERDILDIHREFEVEKWSRLLHEIDNVQTVLTIEMADNFAANSDTKILAFQNDCLELVTIGEAQKTYVELVAKTIEPYINECSAIVDMGCGYGSIILKLAQKEIFKNKPLYAADYSLSGIETLQKIAQSSNVKINTGQCNFLDKEILKFEVPEKALFFTSYSIFYQKNFPRDFIKNLIQYKPDRVINFEPCFEHYDSTTMSGLLSKKYVEYNQYNLDMLSYLKEQEKEKVIKIDEIRTLVHGINPLLVASLFNWKPFN
jgi:hypothetical protein